MSQPPQQFPGGSPPPTHQTTATGGAQQQSWQQQPHQQPLPVQHGHPGASVTPPQQQLPPHQQQAQPQQPQAGTYVQQQPQEKQAQQYATPQQQQYQGHAQPQQQQYQPQQQPEQTPGAGQQEATESTGTAPTTPGFKGTFQNLTSRFTSPSAPAEDKPNVGFTPTPAMVKRHEKAVRASERPIYQFQVTKLRTWRTGYVRLLHLYENRFCTIDPDSHEVTNTWSYNVLTDWLAIPKEKDCILLQVAADKLKLKCHNVDRSIVLTALLETKMAFEETSDEYPLFKSCHRQTRHGTRVAMSLKVAPHGLEELHPTTRQILRTYRYADITGVAFTSDDNTGIVLHMPSYKSRVFFIESSRPNGNGRSDLLTGMREHCDQLGLEVRISESCTLKSWMERRRALGRSAGPIVTTWEVTKTTRRHDAALVGHELGWMGGSVSRRLVVTGRGFLLEMDAGGVVSCKRLSDIYALVRHPHADTVTLEFKNGTSRTYASANRDALLVSLLDAASFLGNNSCVQVSDVTSGGYCLSSLESSAEPPPPSSTIIFQTISIPVHCLKRVHAVSTAAYAFLSHGKESSVREGENLKVTEECAMVVEACRELNANVPVTGEGLPTGPSDRNILGAVGALWGILSILLERPSSENANISERHEAEMAAIPMFQTLYRLTQTKAGYKGTAELDTMQECVSLLWDLDDDFCQFWVLRVLGALLSGPAKRDKEVEYVNKSVILRTGGAKMVDGLVSTMLEANSTQPGGQRVVSDLILFVTSDILQSILCSNHDTTAPEHFTAFITSLARGYRALLAALRSPTPFVIENTALLLHLLSTHAPETAAAIREAALGSGILLQHFHAAIFSPLEGQRFLSRYLCSLWLSGPMDCDEKRLLKRMVPSGFIGYLSMPMLSRMEEEQLDELERDAAAESRRQAEQQTTGETNSVEERGAAGTNTARLRSRIALAMETTSSSSETTKPENFRIFFHVLTKDHALADLIWNQQTRQELRMALENEIQSISRVTESRGGIDCIAWNHQQFTVEYPSLDNEVKVGTVYMRLWLQAGDGFIKSWEEPYRLFELLFRRFLCELDRNAMVTIMCIRCLERLYAIHANVIGPFSDIMILVRSMASTKNTETQHRLLGLVATLLGVSADEDRHGKISIPENAEQLLNVECIGQMCQFVAWGHTNGEQAGNLLSVMLGSPERQKRMITDGTEAGPGGQPSNGAGSSGVSTGAAQANDSACPPVWFVASTGQTPPPPEMIRGPFRVSELMSMMENGRLSPYDQVTASHVEDYNEEDDEPESTESGTSGVKDFHIDTGKWRRIYQVWQLRWQLCADNSAGIYGPSEVALMAIRALTRLVDLHRSLDSRGVPYFPVPIAKRLLCGLSREIPRTANSETVMDIDQSDTFLPILCQSLLCNDSRVVSSAAELLHKLMSHNEEAVSKFYLTGIFLFALNYTGNNFRGLSELLRATHLKQHFRSGFAAAANDSELPLKDRSILGNMLPEGLLFILVNYDAERFAEMFVGNVDNPEVIWNMEMRRHLVEMIRQHLGDFPKRLWQNTTARYEYCPIPGIAYQRLEKEVFCHNYYLNNLCDETRFPDWPIAEPVEVFRACLDEWKLQLRRDAVKEEDEQEEARKVLSLKSGDGSKELRRAYRTLARKYHPDRNPAGREKFEAIQEAYELLLPVLESGGTITARSSDETATVDQADDGGRVDAFEGLGGGHGQMRIMHLLIKTQLLILKRYPADMTKYKYPAYQMLLGCLVVPPSCRDLGVEADPESFMSSCLMSKERAEFVRTAAALVFHTCLVSPLNAEELIAEGGLPILEALLDFYVQAAAFVSDKTTIEGIAKEKVDRIAGERLIVDVLSNLVHTISGVAFYENGRKSILALQDPSRLTVNLRRCIESKFKNVSCRVEGTSAMKRFALEGVASMAKSKELQDVLVGSGIIWPLIRYMLAYDPTLDGSSDHIDEDDVHVSQAGHNELARLSARALGMLSGVMKDSALSTPSNKEVKLALDRLLSGPVARMLRNKRATELLRTLNTNVETPVRIWNVSMRDELDQFLWKMEKERPEGNCRSVSEELESAITSFEYTTLRNEVTVGGVYLRVFNALGGGRESLHEIPDTSFFAKQIIAFIALCMNQSDELGDGWIQLPESATVQDSNEIDTPQVSISDARFSMAVKALTLLVRVDGLVDDVVCDSSKQTTSVLLSLLELPQDNQAFEMSCDILSVLSPKESFANAVATQDSLWRLLWVLERPEGNEDTAVSDSSSVSNRLQRGWALLESLSSSPSIATKLVNSSGWLELLGIIAGYETFTKRFSSRLGAAKALSRLLWDADTGPIAGPLLQRFLPSTLVVILKEEGPEVMLRQYDRDSETPEIIWNGSMRGVLRASLADQLDSFVKGRSEPDTDLNDFHLSPTAGTKYVNLDDELYIGGVYVRLFLKEPTFNLRDPTGFLEKLLIRWTHELDVLTSSGRTSSSAPESSNGTVAHAQQDALQMVTSAIMYLCKVRDSLCDKLSKWGYMAKSLALLRDVLAYELVGTPLLSVVRILHVASNRLVNIEALAIAGGSEPKSGVVHYTMKAIGKDPLHADCAFMVEMLLKVYQKALGDVKKAPITKTPLAPSIPSEAMSQSGHDITATDAAFHVMAPSPAPGLDPVRKSGGKPKIEHPLDHPLAFAGTDAPRSSQAAPTSSRAVLGSGRQTAQTPAATSSQVPGHSSYQGVHLTSASSFAQRAHPLASPMGTGAQATHQPQSQPSGYRVPQNQNIAGPTPHLVAQTRYSNVTSQPAPYAVHPPAHSARPLQGQIPAASVQPLTMPVTTGRPVTVPTTAGHPLGASGTSSYTNAPQQQGRNVVVSPTPQPASNPAYGRVEHASTAYQSQAAPSPATYPQVPVAHTSYGSQQPAYSSFQSPVTPAPPPRSHAPAASASRGVYTGHSSSASQLMHPEPGSIQGVGTPVATVQQPADAMYSSAHHQQQQQQVRYTHVPSDPMQQQTFRATETVQAPHSAAAPQTTAPEHLHGPSGQMQQPTAQAPQATAPQAAAPGSHQQQTSYPVQQQTYRATETGQAPQPAAPPQAVAPETHGVVPTGMQAGPGQEIPTTAPPPSATPADTSTPARVQQYRPTPVEGSGIDARSSITPQQKAEQQIVSSAGAPGSAQGRIALLQSALACELPKFLLEDVLENASLSSVKDPAAAKVHAVALLKLLTMDPGYGLKFKLILDEIPEWKKYKSQDHSLFITGAEQKSDYFLTDGEKGETKLIKDG